MSNCKVHISDDHAFCTCGWIRKCGSVSIGAGPFNSSHDILMPFNRIKLYEEIKQHYAESEKQEEPQ